MSSTKSLIVLFILSAILLSCNGQEGAGIKTASTALAEAKSQDEIQPYVDSNFELDGQICQHVRRILQDSKGNLWIGTNIYGLLLYNGDSLTYISKDKGFKTGRVTAIVEDSIGNVWFGTYFGLFKYDGNSYTNYSQDDGLIDSEIWSVTIDSNGLMWIGTMAGVSTFDGVKFTDFNLPKAPVSNPDPMLSENRITAITQDSKGNMWFATDGSAVTIYNPMVKGAGSFSFLSKKDGLCDNNITSILEDRKGDIWFGSMFGGVSRYNLNASLSSNKKVFENFTLDSVITGIEVWSIYEDSDGNIWFPAENYGVYRYDGNGFTNFAKEDGLASSAIQCFYEDREGRLWLGGWLGLFRYDPLLIKKGGALPFYSVSKNGPWE